MKQAADLMRSNASDATPPKTHCLRAHLGQRDGAPQVCEHLHRAQRKGQLDQPAGGVWWCKFEGWRLGRPSAHAFTCTHHVHGRTLPQTSPPYLLAPGPSLNWRWKGCVCILYQHAREERTALLFILIVGCISADGHSVWRSQCG